MVIFEEILIFFLVISIIFVFLSKLTSKIKLPVYPFYLFVFIIFAQFFKFKEEFTITHLNYEIIYHVFLPIILFESAININVHHLKIQLKTLTFFTTVALIFNAFLISFLISFFMKIPFQSAILFGSLISATDPIGVLAIFKKMKAPLRLKLLIEGESMLNDATTIVFFEILFFLIFKSFSSTSNSFLLLFSSLLIKKFVLSILLGIFFGFFLVFSSKFLRKESILNNILVLLFVLGFYFFSESILGLSGPIFVIFAGLIFANFSFPYLEKENFEKEKYFFLALITLINFYFFASVGLNIDLKFLFSKEINQFFNIVFIILFARAITTYLSFFITNKLKFFYDEPDVYLSWMHIINFSGLRGIIPLILVNQIPNNFLYKSQFIDYTIYAFLFTNLVNPFIVQFLIKKYEKFFKSEIIEVKTILENIYLFTKKKKHLEDDLKLELKNGTLLSFRKKIRDDLKDVQKKINLECKKLEKYNQETIYKGMHYLGAKIEIDSHYKAFKENRINYYNLIYLLSELDLQKDALLYPDKFANRVINEKGEIISKKSIRLILLEKIEQLKISFFKKSLPIKILEEKKNLYWERIISSVYVINYFQFIIKNNDCLLLKKPFKMIYKDHLYYIKYNWQKWEKIKI